MEKNLISQFADNAFSLARLVDNGEMDETRAAFQHLANIDALLHTADMFTRLESMISDNAATLKGIELQLDRLEKSFVPENREITPEQQRAYDLDDKRRHIEKIALAIIQTLYFNASTEDPAVILSGRSPMDLALEMAEDFHDGIQRIIY